MRGTAGSPYRTLNGKIKLAHATLAHIGAWGVKRAASLTAGLSLYTIGYAAFLGVKMASSRFRKAVPLPWATNTT